MKEDQCLEHMHTLRGGDNGRKVGL